MSGHYKATGGHIEVIGKFPFLVGRWLVVPYATNRGQSPTKYGNLLYRENELMSLLKEGVPPLTEQDTVAIVALVQAARLARKHVAEIAPDTTTEDILIALDGALKPFGETITIWERIALGGDA